MTQQHQPAGSEPFERGIFILSLDTEQIWGHLDKMSEWEYHRRYPDTPGAYDLLLQSLTSAAIPATWFLVGGMTLDRCEGASDARLAGLPEYWRRRLPAGTEATKPVWYRRSFVERLLAAAPRQEIGLHGGLSHFVWNDPRANIETLQWELAQGVRALHQVGIRPASFSFPRDREAFHELLPPQGIRCYRGRTPTLPFRLGSTLAGSALRALHQLSALTPPLVWPRETLPGLWNIPSSAFLYPLGVWRSRVVPLRTRVASFQKGIDAAAAQHGIFHFCLHPANLTESAHGFDMLEQMLDRLVRARDAGDIEVLTITQVVERMERWKKREDYISVENFRAAGELDRTPATV